jgi:hypothetical protein
MLDPHPAELGRCPRRREAVALLQGELDGSEARRLAAHVEECWECRDELAGGAEILSALAADRRREELEACPDVSARVLSLVAPAMRGRVAPGRIAVATGLAAALALAAMVWFLVGARNDGTTPAAAPAPDLSAIESVEAASAARWLVQAQDRGGLWTAARRGGDRRFEAALSAMAILALTYAPEAALEPALLNAVLDRGAHALLALQDAGGLFGPHFPGALYNHGLATSALLELRSRRPGLGARLDPAIDRALECTRRTQAARGAWGYLDDAPNVSVSVWALHSLLLARSLGFRDLDGAIERGFRWLETVSDGAGRVGYARREQAALDDGTLLAGVAWCASLDRSAPRSRSGRRWIERLELRVSSAASPDAAARSFYRDLLLESAACAARAPVSGATSAAAEPRSSRIAGLIRRQVGAGAERGSWEPDDRFGAIGGRVYSTAAAALALQAPERWRRLRSVVAGERRV